MPPLFCGGFYMCGMEGEFGMDKMVRVRNLVLGQGIPKICVPLTAVDMNNLILETQCAVHAGADLVEWRADFFAGGLRGLLDTLVRIRAVLGDIPMIFTCRTVGQGGESSLPPEAYMQLCRSVINRGGADMLDIEYSCGRQGCEELVAVAKEARICVVVSDHFFKSTPSGEEMLALLRDMKGLGADLPKLAVMPKTPADVLALLQATEEFSHGEDGGPVVTMAMGTLGRASRIMGGLFGSCVTFGVAGTPSAPGQVEIAPLRAALEILYKK